MKRVISAALTVLMAFSLMLPLSSIASANALTGGGYSSSYSGESVFTNKAAGESGQFSAIFFNDGTQSWAPGVVGLLVCAADKVTCNVASPNAAYASGWYSSTVYATVTATVAPGQNGFFVYNFTVPAGTAGGTVATFNGDVGIIATGTELRPQGYFQVNTTPAAAGTGLTLSPTSASLPVGGTQQFTVTGAPSGATISYSVTGGCGAITSAGLFAATATNSATQPCSVVATSGGLSGSATINVFGPATQIACTANPATATGNGVDTPVVTATLKDANGNVVTNANGTNITFNNNTPGLLTPTAQQVVGTTSGVSAVTYTTVSGTSGTAQVSVSSGTLTGCNATVAISAVGAATKTTAAFNPATIAADGVSTSRLRVTITDAAGNLVTTDNTTQVTISRTSGATICNPGSLTATVFSGRADFFIRSTTTPGTCAFDVTTNNTTIAGGSATLTTLVVGAPNKLAATTSGSPALAGDTDNAPTVVVTLQDANGNRITNQWRPIMVTYTTSTTAGSGCPAVLTPGNGTVVNTGATAISAGRATFTFNSTAATSGCTLTFSDGFGVSSTTATVAFTPGSATGLSCTFSPRIIAPDGSSQSTGTVNVVDTNGNATNTGTYSVSFARLTGTSTTLLTASPQTSSNGVATFTVRSTTTAGTDTYQASATVIGTGTQTTTCAITVSTQPIP